MIRIIRYDKTVPAGKTEKIEIKPERDEVWTVRDITMDYVPDAFVMTVVHKDVTIEDVSLNETVEECLDKAIEKERITISKDSPMTILLRNDTTADQDFTITLAVHVGYEETQKPFQFPQPAPTEVSVPQIDLTQILKKLDKIIEELKNIKDKIPIAIDSMICYKKIERGGE